MISDEERKKSGYLYISDIGIGLVVKCTEDQVENDEFSGVVVYSNPENTNYKVGETSTRWSSNFFRAMTTRELEFLDYKMDLTELGF